MYEIRNGNGDTFFWKLFYLLCETRIVEKIEFLLRLFGKILKKNLKRNFPNGPEFLRPGKFAF